jgi:hypothetical protein
VRSGHAPQARRARSNRVASLAKTLAWTIAPTAAEESALRDYTAAPIGLLLGASGRADSPRDALYPVPWPPSASPHHANAPRYFVSVSQQNVEAMRSLLESYVQGDYGPALDALDPDVELWLDPQTFPESGPFRGRQAVIARLTEVVSSFDDWASAEGAELIDAGDWVVIVTDLGAPTA